MFENSGIASSLNQISKNLDYGLKQKYNVDNSEVVNSLLRIHGLHKDNFDVIKNVESFIEEVNANNLSIDDNSNKNEKTVLGVLRENTNSFDKLVGFRYLYRKLKDLYGKDEAKRLTSEMYDYSLGISDSTKLLVPYCWALDASKIVLMGRPFGQLHSLAPKRFSSYIAALNESVHQMSNHLAGAIAIGSFFLDAAHIMINNENISLEDLKENTKTRKYIENSMQNFVHSVNHLSRSSNESPFSNLSLFDKPKLSHLLADDNMGWYFEGVDKNYIIEYITEVQNIFLDFFDKGDPSMNGMPYRFPVVTLNISKNKKDELEDVEFIRNVCKRDICRYNIFVSEGTKTASCCFIGNEIIEYFDEEGTKNISTIKDFVNENCSFKDGQLKIEKKFTIESFKNVNNKIISELTEITGVLKKENEYKEIIKMELEDGSIIEVTPDHIFMAYKNSNIVEVTAEEIFKNPNDYDLIN